MSSKPAVKFIALVKRRPDLSMEAFKDYYENQHAPLCARILPPTSEYRRNYVTRNTKVQDIDPPQLDIEYDVVTEVWFDTVEQFSAFNDATARPEIREQLIADELKFTDRDSIRVSVVHECITDVGGNIA